MTLTYSTIFLASLIAALVALYIYKFISDTTRSIYRSRKRIRRSNTLMGFQDNKAVYTSAASVMYSGHNSRNTTRNLAIKHAAAPQGHREQGTSWPYRENKSVTIGSAYKVRRKTKTDIHDKESDGKPWGW